MARDMKGRSRIPLSKEVGKKDLRGWITLGEKDRIRERSASVTIMEGMEDSSKRKRGETEGLDKSREGDEVFKRSNKTMRSPSEREKGVAEEKTGKIEELLIEMRKESKYRWDKVEESLQNLRKEIERMKMREQEWEREQEQIRTRLEEVERKLEERKGGEGVEGWAKEMENRIRKVEEGKEEGGERVIRVEKEEEKKIRQLEEKVMILEREKERREKAERKTNIVVRGVKAEEGKEKEEVEKVIEKIGVKVRIEGVRKIKAYKEECGGVWIVRLANEEEKKKVLEEKRKLRGEKIWITEDLTWGERKMKFSFLPMSELKT